ncbi:MAG: 50S ribosomal protein L33 [Candidatus Omnitrophica bacterium]|nr:50S ribosomal protein L33 [bacterium]NUN95228.1 50S ribosomal protein L33 [Candidatus Omnitrophota bacterium]
MPRVTLVLECVECKARNYTITKNKREHPGRVEVKKFCPRCKKHLPHRETR